MKDLKVSIDLKRVGRILWITGKALAVLAALVIGNEIAAQIHFIGGILYYIAQVMGKSVGA